MDSPAPEIVQCPHCGAENPAAEERCQSCGKPLAIYIGPAPRLPRRFGLGSLMLVIGLVAVGLGLTREAPGLGIPFLVLAVPALVRTLTGIAIRRADGRPMTHAEKVGEYLLSFGLMMVMGVAACIAFVVTCVSGTFGAAWIGSRGFISFYVGCTIGGIAVIAVLYVLGRAFWKKKDW